MIRICLNLNNKTQYTILLFIMDFRRISFFINDKIVGTEVRHWQISLWLANGVSLARALHDLSDKLSVRHLSAVT